MKRTAAETVNLIMSRFHGYEFRIKVHYTEEKGIGWNDYTNSIYNADGTYTRLWLGYGGLSDVIVLGEDTGDGECVTYEFNKNEPWERIVHSIVSLLERRAA